jgi:hypothetical protein
MARPGGGSSSSAGLGGGSPPPDMRQRFHSMAHRLSAGAGASAATCMHAHTAAGERGGSCGGRLDRQMLLAGSQAGEAAVG